MNDVIAFEDRLSKTFGDREGLTTREANGREFKYLFRGAACLGIMRNMRDRFCSLDFGGAPEVE